MAQDIKVTPNILLGVNLFSDASLEHREIIAPLCKGVYMPAKTDIVHQEDFTRDVYFILNGVVRVTYFSSSGKEISFREQYKGEMFGELSAIDGEIRSAQIKTLSEVTLIIMNAGDFKYALSLSSSLSLKVMQHMSVLVRSLSDRVIDYSTNSVSCRIKAEVLRLFLKNSKNSDDAVITTIPKHSDIASRVSTHREAVTRELTTLESNGILQRNKGFWRITDIEKLQQLVEEEQNI